MGWSGGSRLADELWESIEEFIPKKRRRELAIEWVDIFEGEDCDTMYESVVGELAGLNDDLQDDEDDEEEE